MTVAGAIADADAVLGNDEPAAAAPTNDEQPPMSQEAIDAEVKQAMRPSRVPQWKKQPKKLSAQALDEAVAQAEATVKIAPWVLKTVPKQRDPQVPAQSLDDVVAQAEATVKVAPWALKNVRRQRASKQSPIERAVAEAQRVVQSPGAKRALAASDSDDDFVQVKKQKKSKRVRAQKKQQGKRVRAQRTQSKKQPKQWNFGPDNGKQTIPRVARYFREKRARAAAKERARILATPEGWMRAQMQKARARRG